MFFANIFCKKKNKFREKYSIYKKFRTFPAQKPQNSKFKDRKIFRAFPGLLEFPERVENPG